MAEYVSIDTLATTISTDLGVTEEYVRETVATLSRHSRANPAPDGHVGLWVAAATRKAVQWDVEICFHQSQYDELRAAGPEALTAELRLTLEHIATVLREDRARQS